MKLDKPISDLVFNSLHMIGCNVLKVDNIHETEIEQKIKKIISFAFI